jgi:hypothetical protein
VKPLDLAGIWREALGGLFVCHEHGSSWGEHRSQGLEDVDRVGHVVEGLEQRD